MPGAMPQARSCKAPLALNTSFTIYATRFGNSPQKHSPFALRMNLVSFWSVQNLATPKQGADTSPAFTRHFPARMALSVLFLAALWFVLCRELSGEWLVNEQYSFGWFVPFFALYLFWLRWQDRPQIEIRDWESEIRKRQIIAAFLAIPALLLLLPVRLFEIANPEWRLLAWIHTAAVVTLTLLLMWCAGGRPWLRHFAFPIAFIFVAVPWPTTVEVPIIQGLMGMVAHVAAETAMLLGIPAQVEGNLIRVSTGLVGVNEACSGIRSLQTSLMIGLLFGELKRLSISRRIALVAGAVAIALFANFLRAVFLVTIAAAKNISEVGRWHDIAGYTIIALVFVGTMALAYLLGKSEIRRHKSDLAGQTPQSAIRTPKSEIPAVVAGVSPARTNLQPARLPLQFPAPYLAAALCWLLFVELGTATWYRIHETNLVSGIRWNVQWPEQSANFRKLKIDEEIRSVLRFDKAEAAAWTLPSSTSSKSVAEPKSSATQGDGSRPNTIVCYLYVFRWEPGRNSALLANLHRPDVCLPASGWIQVADDRVRNYPVIGAFELPFRHFEFERAFENSAPQTAHAFYCLSEDRASGSPATPQAANSPGMAGSRSEWTRAERLRAVLEGRRHLGQQVIDAIFISSEPLSTEDAESHLRDLIRDVVVLREPVK
jgi:exosortase